LGLVSLALNIRSAEIVIATMMNLSNRLAGSDIQVTSTEEAPIPVEETTTRLVEMIVKALDEIDV
jgi:hypothetical protein